MESKAVESSVEINISPRLPENIDDEDIFSLLSNEMTKLKIKENEYILINEKDDNIRLIIISLLQELKIYCEKALSKIHPMEMSGDPNRGITELGLKLLVLGFLANRKESFKIVSERHIQGGRIDLMIEYCDENSNVIYIIVIELKYIRIAFLQYKTRQDTWQTKNNALPLDVKSEEDLNDFFQCDYYPDKQLNAYQKLNLIPLNKIFKDAKVQCLNYTLKLIQGNINPIKLKCNVYSCVIIGIGTHVYYELIRKY